MILTITLNPSMDKTYQVEGFVYGDINRIESEFTSAGGKGINVAKVIKALGGEVITGGIIGGTIGSYIIEELNQFQILNDFYTIHEPSRVCTHVINLKDLSQTELLERGPEVSIKEKHEFFNRFRELVQRADFIVLSGSVPKGFDKTIYRELIEVANKFQKRCLLDTNGAYLKEGIKAKPEIVKPNSFELEEYANKKLTSLSEIVEVAKEIINEGVKIVLVSCGKDGLVCVTKDETFKINAPIIDVKNTVGSGDSLVAGIVYALQKGINLYEACKMGVACGSSNAMELEVGSLDLTKVEKIRKQLRIENE